MLVFVELDVSEHNKKEIVDEATHGIRCLVLLPFSQHCLPAAVVDDQKPIAAPAREGHSVARQRGKAESLLGRSLSTYTCFGPVWLALYRTG